MDTAVNPQKEIAVRELFARSATGLGYEIVVSRDRYPDYLLKRDSCEIRAEAEYRSSNFIAHKHEVADCDLVVCWVHDCLLPLPVLELKTGKHYPAGECSESMEQETDCRIEKAIAKGVPSGLNRGQIVFFLHNPEIVKIAFDYLFADAEQVARLARIGEICGMTTVQARRIVAAFVSLWLAVRATGQKND